MKQREEQCKSYGAPGLMRAPTRLHITWLDDTTLKLETDYGMQTRLLQFGPRSSTEGALTLQGVTTAQWVTARAVARVADRVWVVEDGDDALTTRVSPQEWRALQRAARSSRNTGTR